MPVDLYRTANKDYRKQDPRYTPVKPSLYLSLRKPLLETGDSARGYLGSFMWAHRNVHGVDPPVGTAAAVDTLLAQCMEWALKRMLRHDREGLVPLEPGLAGLAHVPDVAALMYLGDWRQPAHIIELEQEIDSVTKDIRDIARYATTGIGNLQNQVPANVLAPDGLPLHRFPLRFKAPELHFPTIECELPSHTARLPVLHMKEIFGPERIAKLVHGTSLESVQWVALRERRFNFNSLLFWLLKGLFWTAK
jgi:hypothetical protein